MSKRRQSRIYWRDRGGARRAYVDLRDLGGGRLALIPPGDRQATSDRDIAQALAANLVRELEAKRRDQALLGIAKSATLAQFARLHLIAKAESGRFTHDWLATAEVFLSRALEFLGEDRDLTSVTVADVRAFASHLKARPNRRGGTLSAGSVRHHLNALSNLYRRAIEEDYTTLNPVAAWSEKPRASRREAPWLELHEIALILESARTYTPLPGRGAVPFVYPLIATFALTGARFTEVVAREVEDISFDRRRIMIRPNRWSRLKTGGSQRVIRLWPQLEEILREYVFGSNAPPGRLLFPSLGAGQEAPLTDVRKILDAVAVRAGLKKGEVRSRSFRHGYTAARLQTLDHGAPVSLYTVARELGHRSTEMVERTYAHLGEVRHRSNVVEFRIEQCKPQIAETPPYPVISEGTRASTHHADT